MLEGDVWGILTLFMYSTSIAHHPLLQDTCVLCSYFHDVCVLHTWRECNMCTDFVANKKSQLDVKVIWYENFSQ